MEVASKEKMAFPLPDVPSIAVLPFVNMSEDPKQEFLAMGLPRRSSLHSLKFPNLFVIARNSTFTYKGKAVKVKQVSEELGSGMCWREVFRGLATAFGSQPS